MEVGDQVAQNLRYWEKSYNINQTGSKSASRISHKDLNMNLIWSIKWLKNLFSTTNIDRVSDFQMSN